MKSLITRSITGILFGAVSIGLIYYSFDSFLILLLIILAGSFFELRKLFDNAGFSLNSKRLQLKALIVLLLSLNAVFQSNTGSLIFFETRVLIFAGLFLLFLMEFLLEENTGKSLNELIFLLYWSVWFHSALNIFYFKFSGYSNVLALSVILMIWTNDTFAYFTGMLIGKNKLMPEVSPKKTIEGFVGGIVFTILSGYLTYQYLIQANTLITLNDFIIIAIIVSVIGTAGDLIESKLKRLAEVKDSGSILPGHGGILDRFDAWFLVMPAIDVYWMIKEVLV